MSEIEVTREQEEAAAKLVDCTIALAAQALAEAELRGKRAALVEYEELVNAMWAGGEGETTDLRDAYDGALARMKEKHQPTEGGDAAMTCKNEPTPAEIDERILGADPSRPRAPKGLASRFWGGLRAFFGDHLDRRPRWLWSWLWDREFDALVRDAANHEWDHGK